jgi:hypothetical protein
MAALLLSGNHRSFDPDKLGDGDNLKLRKKDQAGTGILLLHATIFTAGGLEQCQSRSTRTIPRFCCYQCGFLAPCIALNLDYMCMDKHAPMKGKQSEETTEKTSTTPTKLNAGRKEEQARGHSASARKIQRRKSAVAKQQPNNY